jgi:hypothetical protein
MYNGNHDMVLMHHWSSFKGAPTPNTLPQPCEAVRQYRCTAEANNSLTLGIKKRAASPLSGSLAAARRHAASSWGMPTYGSSSAADASCRAGPHGSGCCRRGQTEPELWAWFLQSLALRLVAGAVGRDATRCLPGQLDRGRLLPFPQPEIEGVPQCWPCRQMCHESKQHHHAAAQTKSLPQASPPQPSKTGKRVGTPYLQAREQADCSDTHPRPRLACAGDSGPQAPHEPR